VRSTQLSLTINNSLLIINTSPFNSLKEGGGVFPFFSFKKNSVSLLTEQLEEEFKTSVDDYIETCKTLNISPQKSFKGTFNVRIAPELHKEVAFQAAKRNLSLNRMVEEALKHELSNYANAG
jgi:predicted HicB family RNase H-like nuclease